MKRIIYLSTFIIFFIYFINPITVFGQNIVNLEITPININTDIDGYYINRNFFVWRIYTQNRITYMEYYAHGNGNSNWTYRTTRTMVNGMIKLHLIGKPKPGNPNSEISFNCIVYKNGNDLYLDEEKSTTRREVNGRVIWDKELNIINEYRKDDINFIENLKMFHEMQSIYFHYRGSYFRDNIIYVVTPKYPIIEIALIELNKLFFVQKIDIGIIRYENGILNAHFSDRILSVENDLIRRTRYIELYTQWGPTRDIIYPDIGDRIINFMQRFSEITVNSMDFSIDEITERYNNSILINVRNLNYIIKNGIIIDEVPRSGQNDYNRMIEQNNEISIINYVNENPNNFRQKNNINLIYRE